MIFLIIYINFGVVALILFLTWLKFALHLIIMILTDGLSVNKNINSNEDLTRGY